MMTPIEYYQAQIKAAVISEDEHQTKALAILNEVHLNLVKESHRRRGFLAKFRAPKLVSGAYLWGGVGIGKTFLMDCFYTTIPFKEKMRMHFYQFMQFVHQQLKVHQGESDPLQVIARELSQKTMLLCFDELFVSDITDAMLLGRLFKALFMQGVCLVATSNTKPDDLYKNGLQRKQFLPAIALIKRHTTVLHMPTTIDYRLRHLKDAGVFYTPDDEVSLGKMEKTFTLLANGDAITHEPLEIAGREITVCKRTDKIVWFDFNVICAVPRSQQDYLAIAKQFNTVFISHIPVIPADAKDRICLFISLIDVLYDAKVRLVFSAAEPVEQIYSRGYMISEYTRTHSRLLEMQSDDYFTNGLT